MASLNLVQIIGRLGRDPELRYTSNGLRKVQGNAYTLSVRESKAVVVPEDLSGLDEIFLRRKEVVEADKAVIKEALANGQSIPGCELRTNYSLQIK